LAGAVAHIDLPDVRNVATIGGLALNVDLPGAAIEIEVVDVDAAESGLRMGGAKGSCSKRLPALRLKL
jgi:hypothetical protein